MSLLHMTASGRFVGKQKKFLKSSTAVSLAFLIGAGMSAPVLAQTTQAQPADQAAAPAAVEEVVVTGSRIVREGYEAPTPLSVISAATIENRADPNLAVTISEMPAFSGSGIAQTQTNSLSSAASGQQNINLRNLGVIRTLVLLDGNRTVGSSSSGQGVDISSYPQQLISRVDVVTGGASAVYGSDAIAGVVNFVLDKDFKGIKADISGGMTNYGDGRTVTLDVSAGFGFGNDRGHVLISGEEELNGGSNGDGGRGWDRSGTQIVTNPNYTTTNGQPNLLVFNQVGLTTQTLGGVVASGPLKGLAFGVGGVPYQLNEGTTLITPSQFVGGDWASTDTREREDIIQKENRQNAFLRTSYDVTDKVNAYIQWFWTDAREEGNANLPYASSAATEPVVKIDNAFLPASVKAAMQADGLTQIQIGTWNNDIGFEFVDNSRVVNQTIAGVTGNFDAINSNWKWEAHGSYGAAISTIRYFNTYNLVNYGYATDAVVNPANGAIVCRITLTNPSAAPGCQPWNPLGVGVNANNAAGRAYIIGNPSYSHNKAEQGDFEANLSGEPFSIWAGPVSLDISAEHRIESVHDHPDAVSLSLGHNQGNPPSVDGLQSVTEGAIETVVPLAKNTAWAESWDISGAVRFTGYSLAGYVTTWKLGTTYQPIDDIKFRVTRSHDIRAPNIQELFLPTSFATGTLLDPFTGQTPTPRTVTSGNPNLAPEVSTTTGIGAVLTPHFLPGFTASVDYWDVNVKGEIASVAAQDVINSCYNGTHPELCSSIIRVNGSITQVNVQYHNIAVQDVNGLDIEGSYRFELSDIFSGANGDITLHDNTTIYLTNYQNNNIAAPSNHVGENNGSAGPPNWRMTASAQYQLDPLTFTLTGRAVSAGKINATYITCSSGCPTSTAAAMTINNNYLPGALYFDANIQYKMDLSNVPTTVYFTARNIFNKNPPAIASSANYQPLALMGAGLYDIEGVVFRLGVRFKL